MHTVVHKDGKVVHGQGMYPIAALAITKSEADSTGTGWIEVRVAY